MAILISEITVPERRQRRENGDIAELADSIRRLGLIHPIVLNRNNVLIAGFRRLAAVRSLGWTHIPNTYTDELDPLALHLIELEENIKRLDLTWQERHEAIMEYRRLRKEQDPTISDEQVAKGVGLAQNSMSSHVVVEQYKHDPLVRNAENFSTARNTARRLKERAAADEFNTHSSPRDTYTSPLIHADFMEWSNVYRGPKFNLIHCDFPYGIDSHNSGQNPSGYDDSSDVYFSLLKSLSLNLDNFCAASAHIIFWFSVRHYAHTWELLKLLDGFQFDDAPLIWMKDDQRGIAPDPQRRPRRLYEMAFFGWRGDRKLVRMKNNIVTAPSGNLHPHEKAEDALRYFFEMVVDPQTSLLDPTAGSGSALRAADSLGCSRVLGLERNEGFLNTARNAFEAARRSRRGRSNGATVDDARQATTATGA